MELKKAIELRTSVRSFLPDAVPVNDIKEMIRLGGLAPSINNYQPWSFILIQDKETLVELSSCVVNGLSGFSLNSSKVSVNPERPLTTHDDNSTKVSLSCIRINDHGW